MGLKIVVTLLFLVGCGVSVLGQAPGDGDILCTNETIDGMPNPFANHLDYPDNSVPLMDSRDYIQLLPGLGEAYSPWQSVDRDNNNAITTATEWMQTSSSTCQGAVSVCGFSEGVQENWLITQHINTIPHDRVHVQLEGIISGCEISQQCRQSFDLYIWRTSGVNTSEAANTSNYVRLGRISPSVSDEMFVETYDISVHGDDGFYLAVVDMSTCITLTRILVLYYVCPEETSELIIRPETVASIVISDGEFIPYVNGECVENSSTESGTHPILICGSRGEWDVIVPCLCDPGYQLNTTLDMCQECGEGTYSDQFGNEACETCPANSEATGTGLPKCPCIQGYYRAPYEPPFTSCSKSPGEPANLAVFNVTNTSAVLTWSPPVSDGGRSLSEIFYTVTAQDINSGVGVKVIVRDVMLREIQVIGLTPGVNYTFSVTAENDVSSQDNNTIPFRTITTTATTEATSVPSAAPEMFRSVIGDNVVTFSWSPPPLFLQNGIITSYTLLCSPSTLYLPQTLSPDTRNLTIPGFFGNRFYRCSLIANNTLGASPAANFNFFTPSDFIPGPPPGPAEMFTAVAGQREVVFNWTPAPVSQIVAATNYTFSCHSAPSDPIPPSRIVATGPLTVSGFSPNTYYDCSLMALTNGATTTVFFTTLKDYSFFELRINSIVECSQLVTSDAGSKLYDITYTVQDDVIKSSDVCLQQCRDNNLIYEHLFICYEDSPMVVTYRARVEGTSDTEGGSLLSLIEDWVRSGPSIVVDGVLLTVNTDCSTVVISSLTDPQQCPSGPTPSNTTDQSDKDTSSSGSVVAINGGALIAFLLICISAVTNNL